VLHLNIIKQGYDFTVDVSEVTLFRISNITLQTLIADGEDGTANTNFLYLTTSDSFGGLAKDDITLTLTTDTGATPLAGETIGVENVNNDPAHYTIQVSGM
jgi:hypothetical protein